MKQRDGFRKEMQVGGKRKRLEGVEKQSNKRAAETTYHCVIFARGSVRWI